jgi:organic radical activating enzyme
VVSVAPIRIHRPGAVRLEALPPLALYVHLPWCLKKCPYCDFNSHEKRPSELPQSRYLDALIADLEAALPQVWGRRVVSVFIGGGTPSLFDPAAIERLIADIRARLPRSRSKPTRAPSSASVSAPTAAQVSRACRWACRASTTRCCTPSAACTTARRRALR